MTESSIDQNAADDVLTLNDARPIGEFQRLLKQKVPRVIWTPVWFPNHAKKQRRRHIDPTTCERDYSDPEIEFMRAMDDYKRDAGRMFPTCSEVLEVIRSLGYYQLTEEQVDILG